MLRNFKDGDHPFTVEIQKQISGFFTGLSDSSGDTQLAVEDFRLLSADRFEVRTVRGSDTGRYHFADGKLYVHLRGRTYVFSERDAHSDEGAGSGVHRSAMPGRVTAVHVAVGDSVEKDTVLVVVEAMKMENGLRSEVRGTVRAVNCKPGDLVQPETTLVVVEPADTE